MIRTCPRLWTARGLAPSARLRGLSILSDSGLRPRPPSPAQLPGLGFKRAKSETGTDKTGHIYAGPNEGIFFLDNVYPLKLQWLQRIPFIDDRFFHQNRALKRINNPNVAAADTQTIIERAVPRTLPLTIEEVFPRVKEGGAFVKYSHDPNTTERELEKSLQHHLKEHPIKPWFNPLRRVRAFRVRGRPWIEDLYRFPSTHLKVEFLPTSPETGAAELNQEDLYSLFRRYGKIADIEPQPSGSKDTPRYATVAFTRSRYATMARNCMHGFTVSEAEGGGKAGTNLKLTYIQKVKAHWIRDWLFNHPRIVIPALAAIVATITVIIFDPIRQFFIRNHIMPHFYLEENAAWQWIRRQASRTYNIFSFARCPASTTDPDTLNAIWEDRKKDIEQIQTWLLESAETFIVVQGPGGSEKRAMVVDQALRDCKYKLVIDCKPIQEARSESATINAAAREVGYRPVFSWMNSISSLIDLAAQGAIGTKAGFSETLDSQLSKIWSTTGSALRQVALEGRDNDEKDLVLLDDDYLEAHPERRPVVVIDNFLHKGHENAMIYDKIAEWAAALATTKTAHVIFLTNEASFPKSLNKALPNQVFRHISLSDCSPEVGKRFVLSHLAKNSINRGDDVSHKQPEQDLSELDSCIETLGGRLTDLEFLARRMAGGESPHSAVNHIIEQSVSEILKVHVLEADTPDQRWKPEQAWYLIEEFAKSDKGALRYNELLLSDLFKEQGEACLRALAQAELISIVSSNGRPHAVKPGKPVYQAAFRRLTEDRVLKSRLDLAILTLLIRNQTKNIGKYEEELQLLCSLPKQPWELSGRVKWLLAKLLESQTKLEKYEKECNGLKKILQVDF